MYKSLPVVRAENVGRATPAQSTRIQLLLAAERLFALHGMMGVSLRQIVAAAKQKNLSTVHYHFGSREALAFAICDYRMPAIEIERAEALARFSEALPPKRSARASALVRIVIEPSSQPIFSSRGRSYFRRMLAHSYVTDAIDLRAYLSKRYDLGIRQAAGLLSREVPYVSRATFASRFALMVRSSTYLLATVESNISKLPWRQAEPILRQQLDDMIVAFSGFMSVRDHDPSGL